MRGSAPQAPEYRTALIALPLIGSIRLSGGAIIAAVSKVMAYWFLQSER